MVSRSIEPKSIHRFPKFHNLRACHPRPSIASYQFVVEPAIACHPRPSIASYQFVVEPAISITCIQKAQIAEPRAVPTELQKHLHTFLKSKGSKFNSFSKERGHLLASRRMVCTWILCFSRMYAGVFG